ncbi:MAG TPA: hypothetical protein VJM76_02175, partial [Gammaproteobacteria bacterium]|nr:hypothetical protein [Gammaproteobacteria bacterium]
MQQKQLWYMRRGTEDIRGPFPAGLVSRYILLGRIRQTDELSVDKQQWRLVSDLPELVPAVMTPVSDEELEADRLQRLMLAKRWEDERLAGDRRAGKPPLSPSGTPLYNRRSGDRRQPEDAELLRHRIFKTKARKAIRPPRQGYLPQILLAVVILAAAGAMTVFYPSRAINSASDCNAAPRPGVNWNNCPLEGVV